MIIPIILLDMLYALYMPCQRASSIRPTAYASLGYVGLRPRFGYAPFSIGATRREIRSCSLFVLSSLALSTCVVYSPNRTHLLIWAICASLQPLDVHKYVCGSQSCANRLI